MSSEAVLLCCLLTKPVSGIQKLFFIFSRFLLHFCASYRIKERFRLYLQFGELGHNDICVRSIFYTNADLHLVNQKSGSSVLDCRASFYTCGVFCAFTTPVLVRRSSRKENELGLILSESLNCF